MPNDRFAEILAGIEEEERLTDGVTWRELLLPVNRMRVFLIIALQIGALFLQPGYAETPTC